METMLAARLHEIGKPMQLEQVPIPDAAAHRRRRPGQGLQRRAEPEERARHVRRMVPLPAAAPAAGDVRTRLRRRRHPGRRAGHAGFEVGDRVYVNPGLSCGSCRACRRGEDPNCPDYTFMGYFAFGPDGQRLFDAYPYGGLAEYLTAPAPQPRPAARLRQLRAGRPIRLPGHGVLRAAQGRRRAGPHRAHRRHLRNPRPGRLPDRPRPRRDPHPGHRPQPRPARRRQGDRARPDRRAARRRGRTCRNGSREHTDGEGVDIVIDALGPGAPAEAMLEAIATLGRGGVLVDIGGMMERPALDLFAMMCSQRSVLGSLWFSTARPRTWPTWPAAGALDLSVLEHHTFPLADVNDALDTHPAATRRLHQLPLRAVTWPAAHNVSAGLSPAAHPYHWKRFT